MFAEAAEGGLAQAQSNLGYMMESGMGGETDHAGAEAMYRRSMEGGYARAGYNLAWQLFGRAEAAAGYAEASAACDWAMARSDAEEAEEWTTGCATMRKWTHVD